VPIVAVSDQPSTDDMHTGCLRSGGDTRPVLIVGLWRSEGVGDGVRRRSAWVLAGRRGCGAAATVLL